MKKNSAIMVSVTVIFLALILPYLSAAETLLAPRTTTTQPTTTTTSPTLIQQPANQPAPIEGMGVGNAMISVSDSYGNPVKAAAVTIAINVADNQLLTQTTNYQGIASFSGVAVGQFTYYVGKAGYYPQIIHMPLSISRATTTASKYVLIQYGSARVNVVDNGVAVAGARVIVGPYEGGGIRDRPWTPPTDAGGMAFFGNLLPGSNLFSVLKDGYKVAQATVNIAPGQVANVIIPISRKGGVLVVTVKSGTILLAGAVVTAKTNDPNPSYNFIQSATTNSQGIAVFSNLLIDNNPPTRYAIGANKTGYLGYNQVSSYVFISENQTTQIVYDMIPQH